MSRVLTRYTLVHTDEGTVLMAPGTEVSAADAKDIDMPVFEGKGGAAQAAPSDVEQPSGRASLEAWQEFAASQDVDVEGMSRDDIRDLFKD